MTAAGTGGKAARGRRHPFGPGGFGPGGFGPRSFGPRSLAAVLPEVLRPALRRHGSASAALAAEWDAIAGPGLAAGSQPRRLFAGTLTIAASGAMALELQHSSAALMERVNAHLGQRAVTRLRFVQDFRPAPPGPEAPRLAPSAAEAAARAVAGLPPGELREALERLGRAVLSPRRP